MGSSKALRRRCEKIVAELDVPVPLNLDAICAEVSRLTGRPITTQVVDMPAKSPCGLWVAFPDVDAVYVAGATSLEHQHHITLHELSHVLAGHTAAPVDADEVYRLLVPDLDPELVRRIIGRTRYHGGVGGESHYQIPEEVEAETIASMIAARATAWTGTPPLGDVPESAADVVARIGKALTNS
ncbi:hypothetical protein BDK92_7071 [Micromonospora pisi]|uniref:IrrE N-terminal-like domain-containing protein n=1 Tax=Micromonospora pisi TaxID=589240 RepID=A0A495JWS8_9ACTN|nr:hypothetical protein BDK92_7071 [Micromonospora pisi]